EPLQTYPKFQFQSSHASLRQNMTSPFTAEDQVMAELGGPSTPPVTALVPPTVHESRQQAREQAREQPTVAFEDPVFLDLTKDATPGPSTAKTPNPGPGNGPVIDNSPGQNPKGK